MPNETIDRGRFKRSLIEELREAWQSLRTAHPKDRFYSFGLYTTDLADYLAFTSSTEQGLEEVTKRYVEEYGGDSRDQWASLRWSPCDSPLHTEHWFLSMSEELVRAGPDLYGETPEADAAVELIFEVAVEALRDLDEQNVFGTGLERANLTLGIWKGDQTTEERVRFVRSLNTAETAARYQREEEASYEAFTRLSSQ